MHKNNEQMQNASDNGPDMTGHKPQSGKSDIALEEEKVLQFWQESDIFKKSLNKPSPKGEYIFYDGPPFATGTPHYGHILAGTIKDVIPRYRTMRGYHVPRRWGWDCHGVPIENLVQKEHNLKTKDDIEAFGIKNFSKAAKNSVFRYDKEWKEIIPRTGRWVDMENQYTTMDSNFMESVWWAFGELYKQGLIYEGFRSMHISPPLETSLSNFEVNQGYKDITDISVYVKFELVDEPGTSILVWTTTPWTLFGNSAIAVGKDIEYVKVQVADDVLIIAKERLATVLRDKEYSEIGTIKGSELIGKKYVPIFDHYAKQTDLENHENGWKIYNGDFVTTEDGTGAVHIAPAFGEDDLVLSQKENIPLIQHVKIDGSIKEDVIELAGHQAKPKDTEDNPNAHQETDVEVIKMLAAVGKLFEKEKFTHSYPHCWRTDAPLLNYVMSSWFVKVTDYNDKMSSLNKGINWVPKTVGEKRFGNWLDGVKDWGISRSRYWGTPMPIWKSDDGEEIEVISSVKEMKNNTRGTNKYYIMRHGHSDHNVDHFLSSDNSVPSHLIESGKSDALNTAKKLKGKKIDLIYCSPLFRTQETAEIVMRELGISEDKLVIENRLQEFQTGVYNGKSEQELFEFMDSNYENYFTRKPENGETLVEVKKRVGDFLYEIDKKNEGKNILIISHDWPIWMMQSVTDGLNNEQTMNRGNMEKAFLNTGQYMELDFAPISHDEDYTLDLHRPYVDEIVFEKNGKEMRRIPDVLDGWFDSGSMPYAVNHYPFEKKMKPNGNIFQRVKGYPADFIAEGLDQTRGWFYTLMALNTALFGKAPFKNVVVNGLVLAEDGRKMSKRDNNYPEPTIIFDKYGADAVRYYMLSSSIVEAEPLSFSEKGVNEVYKKIIARLLNVVSFYELNSEEIQKVEIKPTPKSMLDRWILSRLYEVIEGVTNGMEGYRLADASRPLFDFVDDLSTWYVRRSRDRVKENKEAIQVLGYVLCQISKVMAPFMPFTAEMIFQKVSGNNYDDGESSVHLKDWPEGGYVEIKLLEDMKKVRKLVSLGLEARDKAGIRVRQPLKTLKIEEETSDFASEALELIKDEVNVKEIAFDPALKSGEVKLDTDISNELRNEGVVRELIRFIQALRKEKKLDQNDDITLVIETNEAGEKLLAEFKEEISSKVRAQSLEVKVSEIHVETEGILKADEYIFHPKI